MRFSKTECIDDESWESISELLKENFADAQVEIIICKNLVIIPEAGIRETMTKEIHGSPINGHKGVAKTYKRMRQNYFWPNTKTDIQEIIARYFICQTNKLVRKKVRQPMVLTDTPGDSFNKVSLDIVGPLPLTKDGNKYILTMQDLLTKFCVAVPLAEVNSRTIAEAFLVRLVYVFGAPKIVLTDQGSNFTSSLIKNFAKLCNIKLCTTTAFMPQSNGSIERMHNSLIEWLKNYINKIRD